jgi:REase_DpnII-MboI
MVSMTLPTLQDVRRSLLAEVNLARDLPCHVGAFRAWTLDQKAALEAAVSEAEAFTGQARHPEHVAALGFGAAVGLLNEGQRNILREELEHLRGRAFFIAGRPRRFEVDGISLLGVALGAKSEKSDEAQKWCRDILGKSLNELGSDLWHQGLVRLALVVLGDKNLTVKPAELAVVAAAKGLRSSSQAIDEEAWSAAVQSCPLENQSGLDAVRLAVFDIIAGRLGQVRLASPTRADLIALLRNVSRGFKRWPYEEKPRTAKSEITRWEVENEYHVQSLLWVILAPVFPDVDDEENLPSIGHANPRADLAVPSLRTLIEVKYIRKPGQTGFKAVMDEIASDTGLYLSKSNDFDTIIAVVWDDCAQTEQHYELQSGIEQLNGVTAAIILSRPSHMKRKKTAN